ncbi:aldehyde dehydrogenase family protein [Streptomyces sp. SID8352]|nr:aldehyde dehydrogenase family protein [Streptomyces sp. SID8352]
MWLLVLDGADAPARSGSVAPVIDPSTGTAFATCAMGGADDVEAAVHSASVAQERWAALVPAERGRVLARMARELRDHADELAVLETRNTGKPLRESRFDVASAARYFEFYAGAVDKIGGHTIPLGEEYLSYTRREPFGVVGVIVPWNAPLQQAARSVAPALAAGNAVVLKPDEHTPLTALRLGRLAVRAGLPAGLLNVVPGHGTEAGAAVVAHPAIGKVFFTGSLAVGRIVAAGAAARVAPVGLELGGKSPHIIFEDADILSASQDAVTAITLNTGQVCSAGSRLLVHESIIDQVQAEVCTRMEALTVGPGERDPDVGPLTTAEQFETVLAHLRRARSDGATVALGGGAVTDAGLPAGYYVQPTVLSNVPPTAAVLREEVFGPVLTVQPFSTDEEAIALANGTDYGLVAGIWTRDLTRAHRVAARLDAGQVFVNEYFAGGEETPFGGRRFSGYGREKGLEALEHYQQSKTVTIRLRAASAGIDEERNAHGSS